MAKTEQITIKPPRNWPEKAQTLNEWNLGSGQAVWLGLQLIEQAMLTASPDLQIRLREAIANAIRKLN